MADIEKVIKGLENCSTTDGHCLWAEHPDCPYLEDCKAKKYSALDRDALELLKEQRPVKVTVRFNHTDNKCFDHYKYPSCGSTDIYYEQHYCDDCGKALDWSEMA